MNDVICPNCSKAFKIDESSFADIKKQVRDKLFQSELEERLNLAENEKISAVQLAKSEVSTEMQKVVADKESETQKLRAELEAKQTEQNLAVTKAVQIVEKEKDAALNELEALRKEKLAAQQLAEEKLGKELQETAAAKDAVIQELKAKIEANELEKKLEVTRSLQEVEKEKDLLAQELEKVKREAESQLALEKEKQNNQVQSISAQKDIEIRALESKLEGEKTAQQLAVTQAVAVVAKERDELKNNLDKAQLQNVLAEKSLKEKYEVQLKDKDDAIERLRDLKAKLSTKMVGETLEQHCETQFNQLRSTAFPNTYFKKDNDAKTGSKGDYIFRDYQNDIETVSIMFEMKNELDDTKTKKKNEDFLKELDKDRREKGCEYAVLVSLLEPESELYNSGIVDVSHHYPKMYVIRPQFFIPIITLLRNAALNSLQYKAELELVKAQNIDITNFESKLDTFKSAFDKNYDLASRKFATTIKEIDNSINHLQKAKDALFGVDRNFRLANNKVQDVSIKKLTRGNPTMKGKFNELRH